MLDISQYLCHNIPMSNTLGPRTERQELIGRKIPNQFGHRETVVLPRGGWEYLDWLADQGYEVRKWVRDVDRQRDPDTTFSEYLEECIWVQWCERYRRGQKCPHDDVPQYYEEYLRLLEEKKREGIETEDGKLTVN